MQQNDAIGAGFIDLINSVASWIFSASVKASKFCIEFPNIFDKLSDTVIGWIGVFGSSVIVLFEF